MKARILVILALHILSFECATKQTTRLTSTINTLYTNLASELLTNYAKHESTTEHKTNYTTQGSSTESTTNYTTQGSSTESTTNYTTQGSSTESTTNYTTQGSSTESTKESTTNYTTQGSLTESTTNYTTQGSSTESTTNYTTQIYTTEPSTKLTTQETNTSTSKVLLPATALTTSFKPTTFTIQTTDRSFSSQEMTSESTRLFKTTTLTTIETTPETTTKITSQITDKPSESLKTTITHDMSPKATTLNESRSSSLTASSTIPSTNATTSQKTTTATTLNEPVSSPIIKQSTMLSTSTIPSQGTTIEPTASLETTSLTTQTMTTKHSISFISQDPTTELAPPSETNETKTETNTSLETTKPTISIETSTLSKTYATTAFTSQETTETETALKASRITTNTIATDLTPHESTTESTTHLEPTTLPTYETTSKAKTTNTTESATTFISSIKQYIPTTTSTLNVSDMSLTPEAKNKPSTSSTPSTTSSSIPTITPTTTPPTPPTAPSTTTSTPSTTTQSTTSTTQPTTTSTPSTTTQSTTSKTPPPTTSTPSTTTQSTTSTPPPTTSSTPSTTQPTTTSITPTIAVAPPDCPVIGFTRPGVGLNEECGENSISGICNISNSVCTETDNSTMWLCMCSYGHVPNYQDDSCMKVPADLFTIKTHDRYTYSENGSSVTSFDMDNIYRFNITNSTAIVLGEMYFYCHASIGTKHISWQLFRHELTINCNLPQSKWYEATQVSIFVTVFIADIPISDYFTCVIRKISDYKWIYAEVIIMDGTPSDSVVGQVNRLTYKERNKDLEQNSMLYIDEFGTIRTKKSINIDDQQNNTIMYVRVLYLFDYGLHVGNLTVYIVRKHFYREPLPEDSLNITVIGIVDVEPSISFDFIDVSNFIPDSYSLLLGKTKLNYTETTEIVTNIVIRLNETEFNVSIIFKIIDINNNAPYFLHEPYMFKTTQSAFSGVVVGAVEAMDIDTNSNLQFTISPQDEITISDSGLLTLKRSISYSNYYADVSVSDGKYTTTTKIHIKSELKQNASLGYTFTGNVKENTINSFIAKIALAGYENFRFFEDDASKSFHLDEKTGNISSIRTFDRELPSERQFVFSIMADKNGQTCSTVTVGKLTVTVEDVNDNPPKFTNSRYEAEVEENQANTPLKMNYPIRTTDADLKSNVKYGLINGSNLFDIENLTGLMTTRDVIDRETIPFIIVMIEAQDGAFSTTSLVHITIIDVNDNSPTFQHDTNLSVTVAEDEKVGYKILKINATDIDIAENGQVRFELYPRGYFQIDEVSGIVSIAVELDRETTEIHNLTVIAKDHGRIVRSSSLTLRVIVQDINDEKPKFERDIISKDVSEDHNCSEPITKVTATDKDKPGTPNSDVSYILIGEQTVFSIAKDGNLICKGSLDYEHINEYKIIVEARDGGDPYKSENVTIIIHVVDSNDNAPMFLNMDKDLTIRYFKTSSPRVVAVVNAVDLDSGLNGQISYRLLGEASSFLSINSRGVIQLLNGHSNRTNNVYNLTITLTDQGTPQLTNETTIKVNITRPVDGNVAQPIRFIKQEIYMYVEENNNNETLIGGVESYVNKTTAYNVSYELIDTMGKFKIDGTNGSIITVYSLDRETQDVYDIVVKVKTINRSSDYSDLAVVRLFVNDTNDNVPKFTREVYYFRMNELMAEGSVIDPIQGHTNITAHDADEGQNAEINFNKVGNKSCSSHFNINPDGDTAYITLNHAVDYETDFQDCTFDIIAYNDEKVINSTASVIVQVTDYNDNSPIFHGHSNNMYVVYVPENTRSGYKVNLTINITDADSRGNGDFEITTNDSCWLAFYKQPSKIIETQIKDSIVLDYESGIIRNMCTIVATDKGHPSLSATATVEINLVDENDNKPEVHSTPITGNISRFAETGEVIIPGINATDKDSGLNKEIYFSIQNKTEFAYFEINQSSGEIKLKSSVSNVDKDTIILDVIVSDRGLPTLTTLLPVTISIIDDNPRPFFVGLNQIDITEHLIPHFEKRGDIWRVTAKDIKNGRNVTCSCRYHLKSKREDIIVEPNGLIRFKDHTSSFDREKELANGGKIVLTVTATDDGSPPKETETDVTINILDINDQSPIFDQVEYHFYVYQNETIIGRVIATDLDKDPETLYSLNITQNDFGPNVLQINTTSGEIYKSGQMNLHNDTNPQIKGVVYAKDNLDHFKPNDSAIVTITVLENKNNYYPVFQEGSYIFTIHWNHPIGHIGKVKATDGDAEKEGGISYSIIFGNKRGYFEIDDEGWISLRYQLDSSLGTNNMEEITLTVLANDHGFIPKSNTTSVIIRITGENPGECIQGTAHNKQVQRLTEERQNWSYALYGLSGALCIAIITTILFLFKWKSSANILQQQQERIDKYRKQKNFSDIRHYQDLDEISRRKDMPYSVSNQQFVQLPDDHFKNRWSDQEKPRLHRTFIDLSDDEPRNRWGTREQNDGLRFILERDDEPIPDYMDPIPDYE